MEGSLREKGRYIKGTGKVQGRYIDGTKRYMESTLRVQGRCNKKSLTQLQHKCLRGSFKLRSGV